jgi:energy-converting hydrogenase Eha subunit C
MEYNYSIGGEVYVKKNLIKEKVYTYIIEITLVLIGVISIIFTIVYLKSCELKMKAFICASITTLIIVSIYSVILFKKKLQTRLLKINTLYFLG